ncbi:unnamed protein product [Bursaphelenchus okinawaensis]|uniref:Uncharacterized protein n=1 Tax=Bursaphelenchus okinawaensis TaxID=465554 RepID=A0A811K858_9BILA|nr:unnamed protein product [Bursaphelenchus okinawaensis]CAG9094761.1 unnamed protein product [Bursaphelenchus okinawaensis]
MDEMDEEGNGFTSEDEEYDDGNHNQSNRSQGSGENKGIQNQNESKRRQDDGGNVEARSIAGYSVYQDARDQPQDQHSDSASNASIKLQEMSMNEFMKQLRAHHWSWKQEDFNPC